MRKLLIGGVCLVALAVPAAGRAAAPPWTVPTPWIDANGNSQITGIVQQACGTQPVNSGVYLLPCQPGLSPALTIMSGGSPAAVGPGVPVPVQIISGGSGSSGSSSGSISENLAQVGGTAFALGRANSAASLPVTLATDLPALPVSGTVADSTLAPAVRPDDSLATNRVQTHDDTLPDVLGSATLSLTTVGNSVVIPVAAGHTTIGAYIASLSGSGAVVATQDQVNGAAWSSANVTAPPNSTPQGSFASDTKIRFSTGGITQVRLIVTTAGTGTATVSWDEATGVSDVALRAPPPVVTGAITDTATSVAAASSTQVIGANPARKALQICGPLGTGATFEIGYGIAATATSSVAYGPAGISLCNRWGPGDAVPTQAIAVYSSVAATYHVEETN